MRGHAPVEEHDVGAAAGGQLRERGAAAREAHQLVALIDQDEAEYETIIEDTRSRDYVEVRFRNVTRRAVPAGAALIAFAALCLAAMPPIWGLLIYRHQ
jgi:hypothetical protein